MFQHPEDWLLDPLNPHAIALTRRNAYLRFVLMTLIRCCNDAGDAEFATDTSESLARARLMYNLALDLSDQPELRQHLGACEALITELRIAPGDTVSPQVAAALGDIADQLTVGKVATGPNGFNWLDQMVTKLESVTEWKQTLLDLENLKVDALKHVPFGRTPGGILLEQGARMEAAHAQLLADAGVDEALRKASTVAMSYAAEIAGGGS